MAKQNNLILGVEVEDRLEMDYGKVYTVHWYVIDSEGKKKSVGRMSRRNEAELLTCFGAFAKCIKGITGFKIGEAYFPKKAVDAFISSWGMKGETVTDLKEFGKKQGWYDNPAPEPNNEPLLDKFYGATCKR